MAEPEFREGYGVALGLASGRLIAEVLDQSDLHLVVLDRSAGQGGSSSPRL